MSAPWRPATSTRGARRTLGNFDSVVLACGSVSDSALYDQLRGRLPELHVLGDAYAPRRLVFATRQAYALAHQLVTTPTHTQES